MNEKFFVFTLMDYAAPGFVSFTKDYYGTLDDMYRLISYASKNDCELIEPFDRLKNGESVKYHAGQIETQFAREVTVLAKRIISCGQFQFKHKNVWGCDYDVNIEKLHAELLIIRDNNNKYIIAYKTYLENPTVNEKVMKPLKLNYGFWGYPNMITVSNYNKGFKLSNTLYLFESEYESNETAMAAFNNKTSLNLKSFFDDVFGDG